MTNTQIKDYLKKYRIDSEEQLAKHIEELKRNTIPNNEIIFPLVDLLVNEKSVLNSFLAENKIRVNFYKDDVITVKDKFKDLQEVINYFSDSDFDTYFAYKGGRLISQDFKKTTRAVTPFFLDEAVISYQSLEDGKIKDNTVTYTSTRHKSKNGETHVEKELPSFNSKSNFDYLKEYTERLVGQSVQDTSDEIKEPSGKKTNIDKPQISLLFKQFPKALEAIVRCSEYGHEKYKETDKDYLNYQRVDGGSKTYADAGLRHRLQHGNDLESGLPHQFHVAWNALAELQLWITENE